MEHLLEALDDDVLALLKHEKAAPLAAEITDKAALFAAISSQIGFVVPPPSPVAPPAAPTGFALAGSKAAIALLSTLAVGVALGVAIDRNIAPTPSATTTPNAVATTASTAAPAPPSATPSAEPAGIPVGALPSAPRALATTTTTAGSPPIQQPEPSARGLAAERGLLDVARGALARGEATDALRATERHASEYPNGALVEEREAIAIKALVALGRKDEARARFKEMERRFPNGLMLRAVKSAVDQAP